MILIVTHKNDFTVDFVIEKLNNRQIAYYRLNCEDIDEKGYTLKFGNKTSRSENFFRIEQVVCLKRLRCFSIKSIFYNTIG